MPNYVYHDKKPVTRRRCCNLESPLLKIIHLFHCITPLSSQSTSVRHLRKGWKIVLPKTLGELVLSRREPCVGALGRGCGDRELQNFAARPPVVAAKSGLFCAGVRAGAQLETRFHLDSSSSSQLQCPYYEQARGREVLRCLPLPSLKALPPTTQDLISPSIYLSTLSTTLHLLLL